MGAQIANRERFPSAAPDGAAPCSGGVSRFTATAWTPAPAQEPRPRRGCPGSRALPSPGPRAPRDGAGRLRFCVPPGCSGLGLPTGTTAGARHSQRWPTVSCHHTARGPLCALCSVATALCPLSTMGARTEARPGSQRVCPGQGPSCADTLHPAPLGPSSLPVWACFVTPLPHTWSPALG